jgi:2-polyprenyl-3-methyl-5-hydroxy-6-metoxy-1,4-benzoquinol methylase
MQKPSNLDVLGLLAYDYDQGNPLEDITVHSDICDPDTLPHSILFRDKDFLFEVEYKALPLCEGRVMDVGSGTGCLSKILIDQGLQVESIDVSQGCVDYQNKNGLMAKCTDFFDLKPDMYDTILLMMNGIGIVGTINRMDAFFAKSKELLSPSGKILMDSSDIAYMFENEDGSIVI